MSTITTLKCDMCDARADELAQGWSVITWAGASRLGGGSIVHYCPECSQKHLVPSLRARPEAHQ